MTVEEHKRHSDSHPNFRPLPNYDELLSQQCQAAPEQVQLALQEENDFLKQYSEFDAGIETPHGNDL